MRVTPLTRYLLEDLRRCRTYWRAGLGPPPDHEMSLVTDIEAGRYYGDRKVKGIFSRCRKRNWRKDERRRKSFVTPIKWIPNLWL